jgi:uncharacterized damage-inducible protein DinB
MAVEFAGELRRLFAWDDWSNRETLRALQAAGHPPGRARKLLAHIVGSEWLWFTRIAGEAKRMPVWPDLSPDSLLDEIAGLHSAWERVLADLSDRALARQIEYVNSKGEHWSNTVKDVLTHVVSHGAYHRGQIASELRAAGNEPAYTDFIEAVRRGYVE